MPFCVVCGGMAAEKQSAETPQTISARYTTCRSLQPLGDSTAAILPASVMQEMTRQAGDQQKVIVCETGVFLPYE